MPYPNEHSARIIEPSKFQQDSFRRKNIADGIDIIIGRLKGETTTTTQAYRFDKEKFTAAEAKKWLKDHDVDYIEFEAASDKSSNNEIEYKTVNFELVETKEIQKNNQNLGIIEGYASTYSNIDRGNDIIEKGAFKKTLKDFIKKNRMIKMHYNHSMDDIIGGFDPSDVKDDEKGLYVKGEINLNVQRGKEAYALAKQGVLSDMSIGYSINDMEYDKNARVLKDLTLWEISLVGEPMNPQAQILSVKTVTPFRNLPIAPKDTSWDGSAAEKRVRKFTNAEDAPNERYRNCFMWYDEKNENNFTAYKLLYCDVIDGELKVVPRAIFEKAALLHGGRAGLDVPDADKKKIARHVQKYYEKMGMESPLTEEDLKNKYHVNDVIDIKSKKEFEYILRESGAFSKQASVCLASYFNEKQSESVNDEIENKEVDSDNELKEKLSELNNLLKNL